MIALLALVIGLMISFSGSAAATAMVSRARTELAEAIARRLRGSDDSFVWVATTERQIIAAAAAISLGVAIVGVAIPGLFKDASVGTVALIVIGLAAPTAILGGYILPRLLSEPNAARVIEWARPVLRTWGSAMSVLLPERRSDPAGDVRLIAREGLANGLGGEQLVMVGGVMSFSERPVRSVMTPRTKMMAVARGATHQEVLATFTDSGYTRLPVYGQSLDEILGMIHAFDLFKVEAEEALPLRPVTFAPESRQAGDLLLDMQRERRHFAVVLDEFGGTAGIVTLEDLLEGLVGEISDEDEAIVSPVVVSSDLIEFDGATPPSEVAERCHVDLPEVEAVSFGGLLAELLGRIPVTGERFALRGMEVDILFATPTKVERVLVRCRYVAPIPLDRDPR